MSESSTSKPPGVIRIQYCVKCKWQLRAAWLAQELLSTFEQDDILTEVALVPSLKVSGVFEVTCDGQSVWSRKAEGRFPEAKELKQRVRDVLAPGRNLGHSDAKPSALPTETAEIMEAGSKVHTALVYIKPHAVTDKVKTLVKDKLAAEGLTVKSEGAIEAEIIDQKKLIDTHFGAIAAKAVSLKPSQLMIQENSQKEFERQFGVSWSKVVEDGLVFNAMDGAKKLEITPDELGKKCDQLQRGEIIKFGPGFYCAKVDEIYVVNGFYMNIRSKFTTPGTSIYYYEVEWPAEKMKWEDFRGRLLGATDPAAAPAGTLRNAIYKDWRDLGLKAQPDTGDNGVHASASPFEALAERSNWLQASISEDPFGKALLASGVTLPTAKQWFNDPVLKFEGRSSIFDMLQDLDAADCLKRCKALAAANR